MGCLELLQHSLILQVDRGPAAHEKTNDSVFTHSSTMPDTTHCHQLIEGAFEAFGSDCTVTVASMTKASPLLIQINHNPHTI